MKLRKCVLAFSMVVGAIFTGIMGAKVDAKAAEVKYFNVLTAEELKEVTDGAVDIQYNTDYELPSKMGIKNYYKFVVTERGYITFSANNPWMAQHDGTLKTMISVVDSSGNVLWSHHYDQGEEAVEKHGYKIGLNPGTYYFRVVNSLYSMTTTENMKYSFTYTADNYFEIEPNNTMEIATPYTIGTTMSGEYASRPWNFWTKGICDDYFKMDLVKGKTYVFKVNMYTAGLNGEDYRIEDATGEEIVDNWDFKDGIYTYECPVTGTYYLRVGTDLVSLAGIVQPYSFSVNEKVITSPATNVSKVTAKKKSVVIKWKKKAGVTGYQIQYSTSKTKISKGKKVLVKSATKNSTTIKKLKKGKVYYFRIRTYVKEDGKTVYSKWSTIKKSKKIK